MKLEREVGIQQGSYNLLKLQEKIADDVVHKGIVDKKQRYELVSHFISKKPRAGYQYEFQLIQDIFLSNYFIWNLALSKHALG